MKRPIGVWIIRILVLIGAILQILGGLAALGVAGLAMTGRLDTASGVGGEALGIGIVTLILGVILLVVAPSFLGLRRWAWLTIMIFELLTIIVVIVQFVFDGFVWSSLVRIIIPLIIVLYLNGARVKAASNR